MYLHDCIPYILCLLVDTGLEVSQRQIVRSNDVGYDRDALFILSGLSHNGLGGNGEHSLQGRLSVSKIKCVFNYIFFQICRFVLQFSHLSAIWWMNSMCIDIWQTFSKIKGSPGNLGLFKYGWQHPDFIQHACWATLFPLFITLFTVFVEYFYNHYDDTIQGMG